MNLLKAAFLAVTFFLVAASAPVASGAEGLPPWNLDDSGTCGVKLVLKNPDLQGDASGVIKASGWFFIQFQAIGPGAERVDSFTFSFGRSVPPQAQSCATPVWITGAYLLNYRGDYTPEDGFFVPINTTLVADGDYGAAVHAYDSGGAEIGRFYVDAKVENGCTQPRCQGTPPETIQGNDKVLPWPRVLPGDGVQTNGDVNGLTVEFAETVNDVKAYVNGNQILLDGWTGVPMDDDFQPGNDQTSCSVQPSPACVKRVWGPAYKWIGEIRQNDIIRVTATDLNGNVVEKIIHLLDPTQGGIVSGDEVDISVDVDRTSITVGAGQSGEYHFTFTSLSSSDAHVNLPVQFDESQLEARFSPGHVVVKPGERAKADLIVSPKPGVDSGTFLLTARPTWNSGGSEVSKEFPLSFVVGSGEGGNIQPKADNGTGNETSPSEGEGSPGLAFVVVGAGVLAAAVWLRRRGQ